MSKGNIRAKFRCMGVEKTWDGVEIVRFQAVYANKNHSICEENKSFWDATPSGELTFRITNPVSHGLAENGEYYYLDFNEDLESSINVQPTYMVAMVVEFIGKHRSGQIDIHLNAIASGWDDKERKSIPHPLNGALWQAWAQGDLKMSVVNKTASAKFEPGMEWRLEIVKAPE